MFRVEKLEGVLRNRGCERGVCDSGSLKNRLGLAAKSLNSEVWILPERRGFYTAASLEGSFNQMRSRSLHQAAGYLCSAVLSGGTEPRGKGMEHGGRGLGVIT